MSIGKKIGGGFVIVLLLALIEGIVAYRTMYTAAQMSEQLTADSLPRMVHYSDIQNDILLAAYQVSIMYSSRDPSMMGSVTKLLNSAKERVNAVEKLNQAYPSQTTTVFIDAFRQRVQEYEDMVNRRRDVLGKLLKATADTIHASDLQQDALEAMLALMASNIKKNLGRVDNVSVMERYVDGQIKGIDLFNEVTTIAQSLVIAEGKDDIQEFQRIRKLLPEITKKMVTLTDFMITDEGKAVAAKCQSEYEKMAAMASQVTDLQIERSELTKKLRGLFDVMLKEATDIMVHTNNTAQKMLAETDATLSSGTMTVMIFVIVAMVFGSIIAFFVTRMIVRPISETQVFADAVASGDLNRQLTVHTSDEVGKLADALRIMVNALNDNINEAHEKSDQAQKAMEEAQAAMAKAEEATRRAEAAKREGMLAAASQLEGMVEIISSASTELSAQIEQSDRGATESATRLSEAATAMNEMNATVQEVARNAGSASSASADTKRKAETGEHVVRQVVSSIGAVQEVSMRLKEDMAQLNERAQDISRIMGVISDIADQTNLLALNAAIEAARAGEAGRGFAVVADEVRKLAEKTMTSTLDVSNAIRAIQESTDKSMGAMDVAMQRVSEATELANQSGAALEEIVATVDATSDQVQAIAAASEEQSAASEEINRSIIEVNDMSRMTAEAMGEANQAVSDLAQQAQRLTKLIAEMKNS